MAPRDPNYKERKKVAQETKTCDKTCHVFAETTHVVAEPREFACVVIPAT